MASSTERKDVFEDETGVLGTVLLISLTSGLVKGSVMANGKPKFKLHENWVYMCLFFTRVEGFVQYLNSQLSKNDILK